MSEKIITLDENDEISAERNPIKKVEILLRKISSPLEGGYTKSFYVMLQVMSSYDDKATYQETLMRHFIILSLMMVRYYTV